MYCMCVCFALTVWVIKRLVVHFGVKKFTERTLAAWWVVLERFIRDRQDALLPGPIKGLAHFLLRVDTKVTPLLTLTPPLTEHRHNSYLKKPCMKHLINHDVHWRW